MARLKIIWTSTAVKQRNYIFEYWNERNKSNSYSFRLNDEFKERIELLKTNPLLGKETDFYPTRALLHSYYSILYKRVGSTIFITGIWDNRQDPEKLLKFLKANR